MSVVRNASINVVVFLIYFTQDAARQGTPLGVTLAPIVGARVTPMETEFDMFM